MKFQRSYGWGVRTPTEMFPFGPVKKHRSNKSPGCPQLQLWGLQHGVWGCWPDPFPMRPNFRCTSREPPPHATCYQALPTPGQNKANSKYKLWNASNKDTGPSTPPIPPSRRAHVSSFNYRMHIQVTERAEWTSHAHTVRRNCEDHFAYSSAYKLSSHWQMKLLYFNPFEHFSHFRTSYRTETLCNVTFILYSHPALPNY